MNPEHLFRRDFIEYRVIEATDHVPVLLYGQEQVEVAPLGALFDRIGRKALKACILKHFIFDLDIS